jgi:hypothetical protein
LKDSNYNPSNPDLKTNKYVLQTTFQTNGFCIQCLVKDVTKPKKGNLESNLSFMDQSKVFTRRKYPVSDEILDKSKVKKIVGWTLAKHLQEDLCAKIYPATKLMKKRNH